MSFDNKQLTDLTEKIVNFANSHPQTRICIAGLQFNRAGSGATIYFSETFFAENFPTKAQLLENLIDCITDNHLIFTVRKSDSGSGITISITQNNQYGYLIEVDGKAFSLFKEKTPSDPKFKFEQDVIELCEIIAPQPTLQNLTSNHPSTI